MAEAEMRRGMSLAWHTAAFGRAKPLPRLKAVLGQPTGRMSQVDMFRKIQQLNTLFGGTDNRKAVRDGG